MSTPHDGVAPAPDNAGAPGGPPLAHGGPAPVPQQQYWQQSPDQPPPAYGGGPAPVPQQQYWQRPPNQPPPLQSVATLGRIVPILLGLVVVTSFIVDLTSWNVYATVRDYFDPGSPVDVDDVDRADVYAAVAGLALVAALIAAAVVFLMWLSRARANSEALLPATHKHSRGWVVGAWFVPIINLWWPKRIVDDVWRASDPRSHEDPAPMQRSTGALTGLWWAAWLLAGLVSNVGLRLGSGAEPTVDSLRTDVWLGLSASVLYAAAAVLLTLIVRRITAWQSPERLAAAQQPRWSPMPPGPHMPGGQMPGGQMPGPQMPSGPQMPGGPMPGSTPGSPTPPGAPTG